MAIRSIVELRDTLLNQFDLFLKEKVSTESMKACNGAVSSTVKTLREEFNWSKHFKVQPNKKSQDFMFIDNQLKNK